MPSLVKDVPVMVKVAFVPLLFAYVPATFVRAIDDAFITGKLELVLPEADNVPPDNVNPVPTLAQAGLPDASLAKILEFADK